MFGDRVGRREPLTAEIRDPSANQGPGPLQCCMGILVSEVRRNPTLLACMTVLGSAYRVCSGEQIGYFPGLCS